MRDQDGTFHREKFHQGERGRGDQAWVQTRGPERRFVAGDHLDRRDRNDHLVALLHMIGKGGFIDIEGQRLAQAEANERLAFFFLVGKGLEVDDGEAETVVGQNERGGAAAGTGGMSWATAWAKASGSVTLSFTGDGIRTPFGRGWNWTAAGGLVRHMAIPSALISKANSGGGSLRRAVRGFKAIGSSGWAGASAYPTSLFDEGHLVDFAQGSDSFSDLFDRRFP